MKHKITRTVAALAVLFALPAQAEKLLMTFEGFPKGTACEVFGTTGKVKLQIRKYIKYTINGDTAGAIFKCSQPDGRVFTLDSRGMFVPGADMTGIVVGPSGLASIYSDAGGGLTSSRKSDVLRWNN